MVRPKVSPPSPHKTPKKIRPEKAAGGSFVQHREQILGHRNEARIHGAMIQLKNPPTSQ